MSLRSIIRDPLLHFLVLAAGLFVLHELLVHSNEEDDSRLIVVDRPALLNFIQFRTRSFDLETAEQQLESFTDTEIQFLVEDLVREEALAREARALGLDRNDYVIKRRLVQKLDYIARGFADAAFEVTEEDLESYFEENKADFYIEPRITFTHVFFRADENAGAGAAERAAEAVLRVREDAAGFSDARNYGERFLYGLNFADRSRSLIESQFGATMTESLFSGDVPVGEWAGPFESEHGAHIVLVANLRDGREPTLDEVRPQVTQQATRAMVERQAEEATEQIVQRYEVDLRYGAGALN